MEDALDREHVSELAPENPSTEPAPPAAPAQDGAPAAEPRARDKILNVARYVLLATVVGAAVFFTWWTDLYEVLPYLRDISPGPSSSRWSLSSRRSGARR